MNNVSDEKPTLVFRDFSDFDSNPAGAFMPVWWGGAGGVGEGEGGGAVEACGQFPERMSPALCFLLFSHFPRRSFVSGEHSFQLFAHFSGRSVVAV